MAERETKERDVGQIVRYLTTTFNNATHKLDKPSRSAKTGKPNMAYILQTEFAYLINDLMQDPKCVLQRHITRCNDFIDQTVQVVQEQEQA